MGDILQVKNIDMGFPGVKALIDVNFSLRKGEIHGLMGENGAGKSTLIKVITGFYRRDSGTIEYDGELIDYSSPNEAVNNGISMVYQEINLIPLLSVAENIYLGRQPVRKKLPLIDWNEMVLNARKAVARLELDIDVTLPLNNYPVAIQQMVSIARALDISARVLILDEPTSSLDAAEVTQLFKVMRKLREQGISIIFITHFLDQVFEITDRITVLRNGEAVDVFETKNLERIDLISSMLGKELKELDSSLWKEQGKSSGEVFLTLQNISKAEYINPINIEIRKGEVMGLAGLLGSGRSEIAKLIYGVVKPDSGKYTLKGKNVMLKSPRDAILNGIGLCPEDRKEEGIIPNLSVRENIIIALQAKRGIFHFLNKKKRNEIAEKYIKSLGIKTPDADKAIKTLSGGNQQKCILARWLAADPEILILDEPTRGIDIGAKIEIQKEIINLKNQGLGIIFISSELEEVVRCSSRITVLRDRNKIGELVNSEISEKSIMHAIADV